VDIDNRFNGIFSSFTPLHPELSPGHRIIDNFSDSFVFNIHNKQKDDKACAHQLDNMVIKASNSPSTAIVVTDASIKNNIATLILHIHTYDNPITKTVYHAVHIISTEAELFAMRYSINQDSNHNIIFKIIIITDSIHAARKIFDPSSLSELLKVDLIFILPFHFYFIFSFIFDLFSIFRTRVRVRGTRSRCHTAGHIR